MNGLILGLYGAYLLWVGFGGKVNQLSDELKKDVPGYFPWVLAIVAISVLTQFESTQKLVKPFVGLLVLNYFLVNYSKVEAEINELYTLAQGTTK